MNSTTRIVDGRAVPYPLTALRSPKALEGDTRDSVHALSPGPGPGSRLNRDRAAPGALVRPARPDHQRQTRPRHRARPAPYVAGGRRDLLRRGAAGLRTRHERGTARRRRPRPVRPHADRRRAAPAHRAPRRGQHPGPAARSSGRPRRRARPRTVPGQATRRHVGLRPLDPGGRQRRLG
ncbi:hypothetical protein SBRY_30995 [Actinacidiphila bryophytorum]|uniref:Uncharacterized protein n=1 Tax=Actinacidiphila bryophytorum TaxID=1436133 RepID=A0A9W4MHL6_9ACTN|nr:hypothetical protein SBRY_30995 [Actinacidiphila bryophytorum]